MRCVIIKLLSLTLSTMTIIKYVIPTVHFHIVSIPFAIALPNKPIETKYVKIKAESAQAIVLNMYMLKILICCKPNHMARAARWTRNK